LNTPKISVIVPVYNAEPFLDRCVKSIAGQTHKNLEIILVNDGSSDRSPQICDEWQKKDDRVIVIHKTNSGQSDAQNAGFDKATGDYISIIDNDDFITDDFLETLYNICVKHECDIAQCDFVKVYNDDIVPCVQEDNIQIFSNVQMLHNIYNELYIPTTVMWNKLYKKHLFENIRCPSGKSHCDEATSYKLIYSANKIAVSSKQIYMYRQSVSSAMGSKYGRKRLDVFDAFEERIRFFDERGLDELREKTLVIYSYYLIDAYNKSKKYIPDSQDILKELMGKYRRAYKKVLFQKSTSVFAKISLTIYGLLPRLCKEM